MRIFYSICVCFMVLSGFNAHSLSDKFIPSATKFLEIIENKIKAMDADKEKILSDIEKDELQNKISRARLLLGQIKTENENKTAKSNNVLIDLVKKFKYEKDEIDKILQMAKLNKEKEKNNLSMPTQVFDGNGKSLIVNRNCPKKIKKHRRKKDEEIVVGNAISSDISYEKEEFEKR